MKTARRLSQLTVATALVCLLTWSMVAMFADRSVRRRRERAWATPNWAGAPLHVGAQFMIIALVAVAGRKILKLRL